MKRAVALIVVWLGAALLFAATTPVVPPAVATHFPGHEEPPEPTEEPTPTPCVGILCFSPVPPTATPKPTPTPTTLAPTPTATPVVTTTPAPMRRSTPSPTDTPLLTASPTPSPAGAPNRALAGLGLVGSAAMIGSSVLIWRRYLI